MLINLRRAVPGILLAGAVAGCSHPPPPVAYVPPPPPVGHPYQVMVDVPPPTSRHIHVTVEQQKETQQAFNVIALKSALMVAALSCGQQDQYDKFMTTFQPHVLAEQHVMDAYFKRIGGYYGRSKEDDFITLLANNQSVSGISQGSMFCLNNTAEYKAVLALKTYSDLDNFVTDQPPAGEEVASAAAITPLGPESAAEHVAEPPVTHHAALSHSRATRSEHVATTHRKTSPPTVARAAAPVTLAEGATAKQF